MNTEESDMLNHIVNIEPLVDPQVQQDMIDQAMEKVQFARALEIILTTCSFVIVDNNPYRYGKVSIDLFEPVKKDGSPHSIVQASVGHFSLHLPRNIWCSFIPRYIEIGDREMSFFVKSYDDRDGQWIRTIKVYPDKTKSEECRAAWLMLDTLFSTVYLSASHDMFELEKEKVTSKGRTQ
jgi:hypothetical protein